MRHLADAINRRKKVRAEVIIPAIKLSKPYRIIFHIWLCRAIFIGEKMDTLNNENTISINPQPNYSSPSEASPSQPIPNSLEQSYPSPHPIMTTISYVDYFGEKQEIEVTKEFKDKYDGIIKKEQLTNRKETRRHTSLNHLEEKGFESVSSLPTPESEYEKTVLIEEVRKLIFSLTPYQQKLIRQLFYEGLTMTEIANLENVTPSAIRHRWGRIKLKIKNNY
jgi:RNA polymerase sigma-70 factor (ECF subfamily)